MCKFGGEFRPWGNVVRCDLEVDPDHAGSYHSNHRKSDCNSNRLLEGEVLSYSCFVVLGATPGQGGSATGPNSNPHAMVTVTQVNIACVRRCHADAHCRSQSRRRLPVD